MLTASSPLNGAMIAALSAAAIPVVTMFVNLLKPWVERLPGVSPTNPADKATHDASMQMLNGIVTIGATLGLAGLFGYISDPSQFWVVAVQIITIMLGADFNYRGSAKSSNGGASVPSPAVTPLATRLTVSPAQVADALNSAIQQAQPAPSSSAQGQPNTVKRLADDTQPVTAKLPIVKPDAAHA